MARTPGRFHGALIKGLATMELEGAVLNESGKRAPDVVKKAAERAIARIKEMKIEARLIGDLSHNPRLQSLAMKTICDEAQAAIELWFRQDEDQEALGDDDLNFYELSQTLFMQNPP
jgi:hypothetical protein